MISEIKKVIDEQWGLYHCNAYDAVCKGSGESHDAFFDGLCQEQHEISSYLSLYDNTSINNIYFTRGYILLLYLVVEKVSLVMNIFDLKKDEKFNGYYRKHYPTFRKIHKRANFIKHPKYFAFCHEPKPYILGVDDEPQSSCGDDLTVIIDDDFVMKYYDSDHVGKDGELRKKLENKGCIIVKYPNPQEITNGFVEEMKKFTDLICHNAFFIDILKDKTVIENYFVDDITTTI